MTDIGGASAVEARARRAASLRVWVGALLFLAMACGYGWFIWHLPQPRIFVVLSAKSESIAYRVTNPDMGVMRIVGMRASALDGSINACVDAVVTPAAGARVEYRRGDENFFTVTIDPGANVFTGAARWLNIGVRPAMMIFAGVAAVASSGYLAATKRLRLRLRSEQQR